MNIQDARKLMDELVAVHGRDVTLGAIADMLSHVTSIQWITEAEAKAAIAEADALPAGNYASATRTSER